MKLEEILQSNELKTKKMKQREATAVSLTVHKMGQPEVTTGITAADFWVGRSVEADLSLSDLPFVSSQHFALRRTAQGYVVVDLASTNGTRLNNRGLSANVPTPIHNGDILRIGEERFGKSVGFTFHNNAEAMAPVAGFGAGVSVTQLLQIERLTIGRYP